jgi:alpha-L-rhamnosidase
MRLDILFCLVAILILSACQKKTEMDIYDLRCENLKEPIGIDKTVPRFSWKIRSSINGTEQTAYQILVAGNLSLLKKNKADLWDSGKIVSSSSIIVPYGGKFLKSGSVAFWKVRVFDEKGRVSAWSPPSRFSVGLLEKDDWKASYIGFNSENEYRECPQMFKSFNVEEPGSGFFLHVNSLGYHEVWLNGEKVGKGILTPAVTQYGKRSLVNTYAVSEYIKKGSNDLIIWLGAGWYTKELFGLTENGPFLKAQLEKLSGTDREIILVTDNTWKDRNSGYTRIGNWRPHQFGGEIVNGTLVKDDLFREDLSERPWEQTEEITVPDHEVTPQMCEYNLITDTIKPVAIIQVAEDTFLIDMGKNLTGITEIHFENLQKSQEIVIEYSDHLGNDGIFNSRNNLDRYIASGKTPEVFKNKFNYHAFRYIRVSNINYMPDIDSITAFLVHTGFEKTSGFECSDKDLNDIHDMVQYTLRCLSIGGDLVDCPHIERLGYGGDGNASTVTAQIMYDMAPLYDNWLQAWADVIREDGSMPHTAPNPYSAGGGPYWCGFIITAAWNTYQSYGDTLLLKNYYPVMKKWLGYVDKYTVDGLLKPWPNTDYRVWYLGDWATPEGVDQTAEASVDLVNNSFIVRCYDNMHKIARIIGENKDIANYESKREALKRKIHETFFNEIDNNYGTGTQIDQAFPLITGVVPDSLVDRVTKSLRYETEVNRNGNIACGLVGIPVLTEWAVKSREVDFMYTILKKRDYPGYLYMIDNHATTTWEHWDGQRSRIHNCYNGIGSWFYQAVGGIVPVDSVSAYRKVLIDPQIPKGVTWAKTYQETPCGRIEVNWKINSGNMNLEIQIPVGTEALVVIPSYCREYLLNNNQYFIEDEAFSVLEIKSGRYGISYKL